MSEVIVVTSGKGGVGKTTTTANIGAALAKLGFKVLLIDTDLGLLKIEDIVQHNINCKVKSFDTKLKKYEYKDIISRSKLNSIEPLLEISIEADDKSIKKLRCTASHRIFTHNRGWIQAKDLTESDILEID